MIHRTAHLCQAKQVILCAWDTEQIHGKHGCGPLLDPCPVLVGNDLVACPSGDRDTESCESLNELWNSLVGRDAKSRDSCSCLDTLFFGRVWSSLAVTLKSQAVPDLLKPLALACDPTQS